MATRVLIADGQGFYRRGIRAALESTLTGVEVLEADCLDMTLASLDQAAGVSVCLVDLHMPGLLSIILLQDIVALYPRTRFAVLSAAMTRSDVLTALAAGLHGYICKLQSDDEVIQAISDLLSGRIYVPSSITVAPAPFCEGVPSYDPGQRLFSAPQLELKPYTQDTRARALDRLTPRQREVLSLMAEGMPNKEIARKLSISEATTKIHAGALMRVLGVRNRTEAAVLLRGWLGEQSP